MDTNEALIAKFRRAQESLVLQYNELGLRTLAEMVSGEVIDVSPDFQRRDRWGHEKQSLLIESFLLNLPIPPVYLSEDATGVYSVIDGRQRLTAICAFMLGELQLRGLQELPELEGRTFSELPTVMQSTLNMRPLRSVTLMRQTDPELKYLVFHRLNSAGEVLNAQEIRNVAFRGPLNDLLQDLATSPFLRAQLKIQSEASSAYRKMADVEYVLRFLTLSGAWRRFSGDLSASMDEFMETRRYADRVELEALANAFRRTIASAEDLFGDLAFKRPDGAGWRDQALAGLYDAQMVALHEVDRGVLKRLHGRRDRVIAGVKELFRDRAFENSVRVGTNTPSRIGYRITATIEMLEGIANAP